MKTKKEIIAYINATKGGCLNNANTSYSKINSSKAVWWFNIPVDKFIYDVHLLLNTENQVFWIVLNKGFKIDKQVKIREDKKAVDLEISADRNFKFLHDIKSGGAGLNFKEFVKEEICF